ncbi:MAG: diguanylate cyclase, partial [Sedimenticola sp.]|nr:diguanylate cyclase [Sedimenticola sp.]
MNTLIVDHKTDSRQLLRNLLQKHGHTVLEAANGEEGLSATLEKRPDLIISDILMPRLDGFRFCQMIKNHRDFQHIPFILYSATFTDDEDRKLAGDIGADLFLEKPQEPKVLINTLQGLLSQHQYDEGQSKVTRSHALKQLTSRIDGRLSQKLAEQQHEIEQHEALFQRLLLNLPGMVYRCRNDRNWSMLFVSHGSRRVTGYDPEAFTGQHQIPYADLIHPDDQEAVWNEVQAAIARAEPFSVSYRLRDADGRERFVMEQGRGLTDKDGNRVLEGYIWDISAQKLAENQRRRFFNISLDLLLVADIQGYARQLSNSWQRALGWRLQELKLRPWMEFVHPDDRQATEHAGIVLSQGRQVLSFENRLQCKDGSYRLFSWNAFSVREEGLLYGVARDITETRHYQVELEKRVNYDQLTGLPNRNLLRDRVEQALGYAQRQKSRAAVRFLDLDGFREINEILGHEQGDQVLRTLADRFAGTLRKGDTVARWGGDEFIFVLTDIRERAAVSGILEQLITQLNLPIRLPENQLVCDGSFGCSFYP